MYESIRVKPCKFLKDYQGFAKNKSMKEHYGNNQTNEERRGMD